MAARRDNRVAAALPRNDDHDRRRHMADFTQTFTRLVLQGKLEAADETIFRELWTPNAHALRTNAQLVDLLARVARRLRGAGDTAIDEAAAQRWAQERGLGYVGTGRRDLTPEQLDQRIQAYARKHGIDYVEALDRVGRELDDERAPDAPAVDPTADHDALDRRVLAYAREHDVDYIEALDRVQRDGLPAS